jgi:hypothetical protein
MPDDPWNQFPLANSQWEKFPVLRGAAYGPSQGEFSKDQMNGPLGALQKNDLALSPNQQKNYPLGTYADAYKATGEPIASDQRIADSSFVKPHHPTTDTAEFWNGQDQGQVRLVPSFGPFGDKQDYNASFNAQASIALPQAAPQQAVVSPQVTQILQGLSSSTPQAAAPTGDDYASLFGASGMGGT